LFGYHKRQSFLVVDVRCMLNVHVSTLLAGFMVALETCFIGALMLCNDL